MLLITEIITYNLSDLSYALFLPYLFIPSNHRNIIITVCLMSQSWDNVANMHDHLLTVRAHNCTNSHVCPATPWKFLGCH